MKRRPGVVPLDRALSKLGLASRTNAKSLIAAGRVAVDGTVITDARTLVRPERIAVAIDGQVHRGSRESPRLLAFHKPRGVVTSRRDPSGRPTVFDVLGERGEGLIAVGRLDMASTGLLLFTNDTRLADWLTDPASGVPRRYVVTVRGRVGDETARQIEAGIEDRTRPGTSERLRPSAMTVRKTSNRETHLIVELTQGKNREIRRLFAAFGHEVTRVHRVAFGSWELGDLQPGHSRELDYKSSLPNFRSQRSASRQFGQTTPTSRQNRRE